MSNDRQSSVGNGAFQNIVGTFMGWMEDGQSAGTTNVMKRPSAEGSPAPKKQRRLAIEDQGSDEKSQHEDSEADAAGDPTPKPPLPPKRTAKEDMMADLQKSLRKLGTHLSMLLKQKMIMKRSEVSKAILTKIKARHAEGEVLRRTITKIIASGEDSFSAAVHRQTMKDFHKFEGKAKKELKQGKPFCH